MEFEVLGQKKINRNGGEYYNGKALSQEKREKILEKWLEGQKWVFNSLQYSKMSETSKVS